VPYSFTLGQDVLSWSQSTTKGSTLHKNVIEWQVASEHNVILTGTNPALDTENTENGADMKKEEQERELQNNGQCSRLLGGVAWETRQPCYPARIWRTKHSDHRQLIHFRHGKDRQRILVSHPT
jgi:hypothetical protein